jgi:LSD1 subclass zinc finger protein
LQASPEEKTEPRCASCGNLIDEEDLFCSNCGREAERQGDGAPPPIEEGFIGFDCTTCGASLTYDARAEGLRCSFCGSVTLVRQAAATGRIRARSYMPFEVEREAAQRAFERWIGSGFFRPFGIREKARLVSMNPVYVPFWSFHGRAHTYWAADSSRTPPFARAEWCPVSGEREGEVPNVLVPASGSISEAELGSIAPYDLARMVPYRREDLAAYAVEDFGRSRRESRDRARRAMVEAEREACAALVPGRSRNVHVSPLFFDLRSDPVLLPIWINAFRYEEKTYRFLVNGQTGKVAGDAPFSLARVAIAAAVAIIILLILLLVAGG